MGQDLVLLHGWAMTRRVWEPVMPGLAGTYRVHNLSLPGYGGVHARKAERYKTMGAGEILDQWSDECLAAVPAGAIWIGWSLGAMIVMNAVLHAAGTIQAAILVSATPKFTRDEGWDAGAERCVMRQILDGIRTDDRKVLQRFVLLQAGASDDARRLARVLSTCIVGSDTRIAALEAGLRVLEQVDLRFELSRLDVPVRVIHGAEDRITPLAAGAYVADRVPSGDLWQFDTGHAPFITRPELFVRAACGWT
ncbi:MAG: Pimeloyl-[acyl-carrier protein] methyl ester esterase [Gammaproteobacteria bacterium]|nr:Pimeloyl-[acyl-carrier protein] methyl ester esterase [Gammaproteobacteria bacterium]